MSSCDRFQHTVTAYGCVVIILKLFRLLVWFGEDSLREDMKAVSTLWDELQLAISVFPKPVSHVMDDK